MILESDHCSDIKEQVSGLTFYYPHQINGGLYLIIYQRHFIISDVVHPQECCRWRLIKTVYNGQWWHSQENSRLHGKTTPLLFPPTQVKRDIHLFFYVSLYSSTQMSSYSWLLPTACQISSAWRSQAPQRDIGNSSLWVLAVSYSNWSILLTKH